MTKFDARWFMSISRRKLLLQSLVLTGALALPKWAGWAFAANDGVLRAKLHNDINRLYPARKHKMINILDFIDAADHDSIYDGTGVYVDDAWDGAYLAAKADATAGNYLRPIVFPPGKLKFARTIDLRDPVVLIGAGSGLAGRAATIMEFDADLHGILIRHHRNFDQENGNTWGAANAQLRGVHVEGGGKNETTGHGIWITARATLRDCRVHKFAENGIHIVATSGTGSDPLKEGNANHWGMDMVSTVNNGGHGIYVDGADVNAGVATGIDSTSNGGCGIYDSSFLGNSWLGCHTAANGDAAYKSDGSNARCVWLGCYSEGNQPASEFNSRAVVIGGLHGAGIEGGLFIGEKRLTPFSVRGESAVSGTQLEYHIGQTASSAFQVEVTGDTTGGLHFGWFHDSDGTYQIRHGRTTTGTVLRITSNMNTYSDVDTDVAMERAQVILPHVWVNVGSSKCKKIDFLDLLNRIEALESA